jgi:hypothetical protein
MNGWPSALQWERFWDVKAGGSHSREALVPVTTALRYIVDTQLRGVPTRSLAPIYAPNHLGVKLRLP